MSQTENNADPAQKQITECLRAAILAEDALRNNPQSWRSVMPNPETEEGRAFVRLKEAHAEAKSKLWMATDIEYDRSPLRDAAWNWRYWKIMARKCCWNQRFGSTFYAGRTMKKLADAEMKLVQVCGLTDIYRSACSYIEEAFPNLKSKK